MSNLRLPVGSQGAAVGDYDRDGKLDLYVFVTKGVGGSWLDGTEIDRRPSALFRNKGNWQFENVTAKAGTPAAELSPFSAVWFDADDDGWPDLYVINEFGTGILYHNRGDGTFAARPLMDGPYEFGAMGVSVGDIDNDGKPDLYVGAMFSKAGTRLLANLKPGTYPDDVVARIRSFVVGNRLHRNLGGLRFEDVSMKWQVNDAGWAYGPAMADFDNDGWLDLYSTAGHISRDRNKPDG